MPTTGATNSRGLGELLELGHFGQVPIAQVRVCVSSCKKLHPLKEVFLRKRKRVETLKAPPGLLSNQGEKSINFYFIRVPLRKKVIKYGTPKPSPLSSP